MEDYAILIILFLMAVCLLILTVIGYWGVFCKAGEKGWKVLIPFYNEYLLFKIAWKPSICLFKWLCLFLYEVVSVTLNIDTVLNTPFLMEIHGVTYNDEKVAGEMLVQACTQMKKAHADAENIGSFLGFQMKISYSLFDNSFYVRLTREASFIVEVKKDPVRNIERILTAMRNLPGQKKTAEERLEDARQQLVQAKEEVQKPFEKEEELKFIQARLVKVNAELDVGSDEEKIQKDGKNRQEEQRICL